MSRQPNERTIVINGPLTSLSFTAAIKADQLQVRINNGYSFPSIQVDEQISEVSREVDEALREYIKVLEKSQNKLNNLIRQNNSGRGQPNNRRQAASKPKPPGQPASSKPSTQSTSKAPSTGKKKNAKEPAKSGSSPAAKPVEKASTKAVTKKASTQTPVDQTPATETTTG